MSPNRAMTVGELVFSFKIHLVKVVSRGRQPIAMAPEKLKKFLCIDDFKLLV